MADQDPISERETGADLDPRSTSGIPLWVKVSGVIVIVLLLIVVIIIFTGIGGEHGPGRHFRSSGPTPTIEQGVQQP